MKKRGFIAGLIIGGALGAIAAALLTPKTGKDTREWLQKTKDDNQELLDDTKDAAEKLIHRTKQAIEESLDKLSSKFNEPKNIDM